MTYHLGATRPLQSLAFMASLLPAEEGPDEDDEEPEESADDGDRRGDAARGRVGEDDDGGNA